MKLANTLALVCSLSLSGLLGACSPLDDEWETPPLEDDLVDETPGGKSDTGYLSTLAAELEGTFTSTVKKDVRELSPEERQAELEKIQSDTWTARSLADKQIKFAKNRMNADKLHLNLSSSDVEIVNASLSEDGFITVEYQSTVETIVSNEELEEAGISLEQILESTVTAVVPDDPSRMHSDVGGACLDAEHEGEPEAYNYFYYYEPDKEGCAEAMATAGIGRIEAKLQIRNLAPSTTVFPEYDQLTADGKIDAVAFFGAADHDYEPGDWDWGTYGRDRFVSDLRARGFSKEETEEGDLYTRTEAGLLETVRVIGPETLKLLAEDTDGLFKRHVSANEIIFYNGHSFYGSLSVLNDEDLYPGHYQIFVMNSCWSYEYYTKQIFRHNSTAADPEGWLLADVVNDTESGWFHNMWAVSRIVLTNVLRGAETGGVEGDRYYTWDRIVGAMNKLAIESQAEHNSATHEIFGVSGVKTNRFDPTGNVEPPPDGNRFESDREVVIPDNDPNGATDSIAVPVQRQLGSVTIDVSIEHSYVGDLTVTLLHGDKYFVLHSREGGSDDNLDLHLTTDHFSGMDAAGDWTLKIVDNANLDSGKLTGWAIEL